MTKQEIIDALIAVAASLDAIKDSSTDGEFRTIFRSSIRPIDRAAKDLAGGYNKKDKKVKKDK